jgi:hypothetical protein
MERSATTESSLEEEINGQHSAEPTPSFRSMLAGRTALIEPPDQPTRQRYFKIRAAETHRERVSASILVNRMYATRGYCTTEHPTEVSPHRKTFLASDHNAAIGTLTIGLDSAEGLLADDLFSDEVKRFRDRGLEVCEFTKLAMDRRARSPKLLAGLFHVAYIYAHRIHDLDCLLIEVNPRHVRYYESMLGFKVVGNERHNLRVNAPAVLLCLDLRHAQQQICTFGGRPELSATERSAYPHFFSSLDEVGIVGRLQRADDDIAHVYEYAPVQKRSVSRVAVPVH